MKNNYPKSVEIKDTTYNFRLMTEEDRDIVFNFAQHLPERDLLFMRRDITQLEALDEWLQDLKKDRALTLLIEDNGAIIAYGTLYYNQLFWNRHLGEIRFMVSSPYRNRGVGTRLANELKSIAASLNLEKVVTYMATEDKGAQHVLEELGFKAEAILTDWVKTRDNRTHDLLIMSASLRDVHG